MEKTEAERIEVEKVVFCRQEDMDITFHKAKAKEQREARVNAKVKKETVQKVASEKAEGSKKCSWDDPVKIIETVRLYLMEHRVQWMVKANMVCDLCEKKEKKCF